MKKYKYYGQLEKLLKQNKGEILDIIEGNLIDNILISTKRGYIALIETYMNCWSSYYTLNFSKNINEISEVWESYDYRRQ